MTPCGAAKAGEFRPLVDILTFDISHGGDDAVLPSPGCTHIGRAPSTPRGSNNTAVT